MQTRVNGFTVNDGAAQRSRIVSIRLNFSQAVDWQTLSLPGEIRLTRTKARTPDLVGTVVETGAVGYEGYVGRILIVNTTNAAHQATLDLVFQPGSGANNPYVTPGVENYSLADGYWQLSIPCMGYRSGFNDTNLRRLFGDVDANGIVNNSDQMQLNYLYTNNLPSIAFDFSGPDGVIDADDVIEFGHRLGNLL